ncbi:uncharacterized protein LOC125647559 isoform X2 [Ostrea edulis]|uniref:uncharacterized protein LOC125647559 isoform X2 n=1 Tax=Ostrea edulis TaxID=37623 RepID=UPI00209616C3|nr:uncharacterized protein LOC125647559 isoform X2 [Ostrea edulis]
MMSNCFINNSAISFIIIFMLSKLNGNTCNIYNTTCLASCPTIKRVHACPVNDEEKKEREKQMACEKITQTCSEPHRFKYHCIIDERGDLMEICAPMVCILGQYCAEFNLGGGLVQEHFDRNCTSCPFKYDSSTLYRYSWSNTDPWTHQRWDQVPRRSKHPLLTGHTRREPYILIRSRMFSSLKILKHSVQENETKAQLYKQISHFHRLSDPWFE